MAHVNREPVLAIDLGVSKASVAAVDADGEARLVGRRIPPLVSFHPDGSVLVGDEASARRCEDPHNTLSADLRRAGVRTAVTRAGEVTVADVVALVLDHVRRRANEALGDDTHRVIIPVRMGCGTTQQETLARAVAGVDLRADQLAAPIAIAHAFGPERLADAPTAIIDFGAGSFECSLVQVAEGSPTVTAWATDMSLGGNDLDERIVRRMMEAFWRTHELDLSQDAIATARLWLAAEWARPQLADRREVEVVLDGITATDTGGRPDLRFTLQRAELLDMVEDLMDRALGLVDEAMRRASLRPAQVGRVLVVGGASRTPLLRERLAGYFGRALDTSLPAEDACALGAAAYSARIATLSPAALERAADRSSRASKPVRVGRVTTKKLFTAVMPTPDVEFTPVPGSLQRPQLIEVMASPLALSTVGGYCEPLIPADVPVPAEHTRTFSTSKDHQTTVRLGVCQGASRKFADNADLGVIVLADLPPRPRGAVEIEVTFAIDGDGVLLASARDKQTGREHGIRVQIT